MLLLWCPSATLSAHHFHSIPITDSRYSNVGTLSELVGSTPLYEWITYTGDDGFTTFFENETRFVVTNGEGLAVLVFDAPIYEDVTSTRTTAFYELEVSGISSATQSLEVGVTDLNKDVVLDEGQGTLKGTADGLEVDDVSDVARWSDLGNLPLRVQIYYHFHDLVFTLVLIDDATGASTTTSWQSSSGINPFENFYPLPGTDPDNLDIYSFVKCEDACDVTFLDWRRLNCETAGGAVDVASCAQETDLGITTDDAQTTAVPGQMVIYASTATNHGPTDVVGATVTDTFPAALDCVWSCFESSGASCTAAGSGDIDESVDLPVGATASFFATCHVDSAATGALVNVATITPPSGVDDVFPANDSAVDADLLTPQVDLWITKSDGMSYAPPGTAVTYAVVVGNDGPSDALASDVEDLLPDELIECSWTCSPMGGALCTGGPVSGDMMDNVDLPTGSQAAYTLDCTVDHQTVSESFSNTATIAPAEGVTETDSSDNAAIDTDSTLPPIFADGFESGDTTAWSVPVPETI